MKKSKKVFITVLFVLVSIAVCLGITACGKPKVVGITVKSQASEVYVDEFDYSDYSIIVAYDNGSTDSVALTSQYLSLDDQSKISIVGTHVLTVNYMDKTTTFSITLKNHDFTGVDFKNKTTTHDGFPQTIEVDCLPDGAVVLYSPQNTYTEVGEYTVTATITKEYYNDLTLTATLKITDIMRKITFVQAGFADVVIEVADGSDLSKEDIPAPQEVNGYDGNYWHYAYDGITPVVWKKEN